MSDELMHLQKRLADEGRRMVEFFEALSDDAWEAQVYSAGSGWHVRQVLAHFVSAERTYLHYLSQFLTGGPGLPDDFDIDEFNESQVPRLSLQSIPALIDDLRAARSESLAVVANLTPGDLDRRGRHPWLGDTDLRSVLKLVYRHAMIHMRDIRHALHTGAPIAEGSNESGPAEGPSS